MAEALLQRLARVPSTRPLVMGILNVTPDSFSDGGRFLDPREAVRQAQRMFAEGADLVDVGGESTRPGSLPVPLAEELHRTIPVIRALAKHVTIPISIDTSKADVAQLAVEAGASLINDVTALRGDARMALVAARARVPIVLMHMRGRPRTMQARPRYRDVVSDVREFLAEAIERAERAGIASEAILVDPGLGFGKTAAHNLQLLQQLHVLQSLGKPVVVGASRKSFIGRTLDRGVEDRLAGSLACAVWAAQQGAHVVRVHDVRPTVEVLTMWSAIRDASRSQRRPRRHRPAGAARRAA